MSLFAILLLLAVKLTSAAPADVVSLIMQDSGADPGNFVISYFCYFLLQGVRLIRTMGIA